MFLLPRWNFFPQPGGKELLKYSVDELNGYIVSTALSIKVCVKYECVWPIIQNWRSKGRCASSEWLGKYCYLHINLYYSYRLASMISISIEDSHIEEQWILMEKYSDLEATNLWALFFIAGFIYSLISYYYIFLFTSALIFRYTGQRLTITSLQKGLKHINENNCVLNYLQTIFL